MVAAPLSQSTTEFGSPKADVPRPVRARPGTARQAAENDPINWARVAAAGSLALSGVLLMSGRRRAGLVSAVTGTALAMLDQQDSMKAWWETLPVYLEEVQRMLNRVQGAVDSVAAQRDRLHRILSK